MSKGISADEARRFYDKFGSKQDSQGFYEDPAIDRLVQLGGFREAKSVFELGSGTGRLAHRLLERELPPDAEYLGVDVSRTMVDLTTERLKPFGARAKAKLTPGGAQLEAPDAAFDRVVACYVFDLLDENVIRGLLSEARRLLRPGGQLTALCITHGEGPFSRVVSGVWSRLQAVRPSLVGGCRPITLLDYAEPSQWSARSREVVTAWGVASEVVIATA